MHSEVKSVGRMQPQVVIVAPWRSRHCARVSDPGDHIGLRILPTKRPPPEMDAGQSKGVPSHIAETVRFTTKRVPRQQDRMPSTLLCKS